MSSKRDNFLVNSIIAPKKPRMASDDDHDDDDDDNNITQHPVDEGKRRSKQGDCINVTNLEEKSHNSTIDTASQIDKLSDANDTNDDLINKRINLLEANKSLTHSGKDNIFKDTSKNAQICNEKSVDKIFSNSSRPKKSFQISSDHINSSSNSNEEELFNPKNNLVSDTKTVIGAACSLDNGSTSIVMTSQKSKKEINLVDGSPRNISENINIDDNINMFTSDPCNSKSTDIDTFNENPAHDQEQFRMSFKNQTSDCISLFTEDERDAIAKLIMDSNLINNEMENYMFPENSNGMDIIENIIRSDDESESDLDEKENSENGKLLQNSSEIHNSHESDNSNNILDTNEEINLHSAQITDSRPLSVDTNVDNGYENPISELVDSRSSSRVESPLGAANDCSNTNIDVGEDHDADSPDDLLEAELTGDESQNSTIETRIVQPQTATSKIKAPIVNVLRLEILTTRLNESSSDEQYKAQRTIHIIENEAHMIRLQKLLYNPNPQYFEGVDRFNLIQGTIPDIIEVLKAYPDSTHHAHVRIFNPNQESYKNTVCNTYIKNSSSGTLGDCPICMYTLYNPVSTWCGHIFCENCLLHAIEYNRECPSCRKHLSIPYYHKVFM